VTEDLALTGTLDILEDIALGQGPVQTLVLLGYCGWGPGQLESEIAQNAWLIGDAPFDLVFGTEDARKWDKALANENIDILTLSSTAGHA
jgi:putative transcriptional regulator